MAGSILGTRVLRTEDPELLLGSARYVADLDLPDALHVVFVRSDMAHARIRGIDTADAASAPGVVAVFTADDLGPGAPRHRQGARRLRPTAAGRRRSCASSARPWPSSSPRPPPRRATRPTRSSVDYEPLPAVVRSRGRARRTVRRSCSKRTANNIAVVTTDPVNDAIFGDADVVVRGRYVNQRIAVAPMEPHGCRRRPGADGRLIVLRLDADAAPAAPDARPLRSALDTSRGPRDHARTSVAASAARPASTPSRRWSPRARASSTGRDVDVDAQRGHARARRTAAARSSTSSSAAARDGTFTGLRVRLVGDAGAYPRLGAFLPPARSACRTARTASRPSSSTSPSPSRTPRPTGAYRGAGRPEATALLERARRPRRARAGHRPDRAAPAQPAHRRRVPVHDAHRRHLRQRSLPRPARRGGPAGRLRRAPAPSRRRGAQRGDRKLLGIGVAALRRDHRRRRQPASSAPSRSTTTARPRCGPARPRTDRATRPRSR